MFPASLGNFWCNKGVLRRSQLLESSLWVYKSIDFVGIHGEFWLLRAPRADLAPAWEFPGKDPCSSVDPHFLLRHSQEKALLALRTLVGTKNCHLSKDKTGSTARERKIGEKIMGSWQSTLKLSWNCTISIGNIEQSRVSSKIIQEILTHGQWGKTPVPRIAVHGNSQEQVWNSGETPELRGEGKRKRTNQQHCRNSIVLFQGDFQESQQRQEFPGLGTLAATTKQKTTFNRFQICRIM